MSYLWLLQFLFSIFILSFELYSADGSLDTTFGTSGLVQTSFGGSDEQAFSMVLQPDGKIVLAGYTDAPGHFNFALARYNSNGSLDTTFGTGGLVSTTFGGGSQDQAFALVRQTDGKLVAVGVTDVTGNNNFGLARYNTNGALDTTFGTGGLVNTNFGGTSIDQANAAVLQPDGKIIAVGFTNTTGNNNFALARYNTNGALDTTFGTGGLVNTNFGGTSADQANAVVLQPDGKIIAVGVTNTTGNNNFALARYNTNGALDTTFGTSGLVNTNFSGTSVDQALGVTLQTDGKIIVVGVTDSGGSNRFALARYNTNGSLDTTFGTSGLVTTVIGNPAFATSVIWQSANSKIIVGGRSVSGGNSRFTLARYTSTGALDSTFGIGGIVTTQFPASTADGVASIVLQPDGKILAAGFSQIAGVFLGFGLARYLNCPGSNIVGSDTVLTLFTTPQLTEPNGRFAKLAMLQGGFGLCGNGTFDSCFPIVGTVCLECFTLTMQKDIIMDNISYFGSLGNIIGNAHVLELAQSVTSLPNFVCSDPFISPAAPCPNVQWGNIVVSLNSDVTLQDTIITFTGNSTLIGNNNVLTLDNNSGLIVGSNAQLTMKNITIQGVNGTKIQGTNSQSLLILENVEWILDGNYTFATGRFNVTRDFYVTGENRTFTYQSTQLSSIDVNGRLIIGHNVTFRYAPTMALKNLLSFTTNSSQMILKGSILRASNVGMNLLKGIMRICRSSTLFSEGANTAQGISLGDGISSSNNLDVQINPAAQLVIQGPVVYNNV